MANDNRPPLWGPPLRETSLQDDYMYPFSTHIIRTTVPDGLKQNMSPPIAHLVDLTYPRVDPKPGSLSQRSTVDKPNPLPTCEREVDDGAHPSTTQATDKDDDNDAQGQKLAPFGEEDASQVLRAEDVDQAMGFRTFHSPGYAMVDANEDLHHDYPPVHRLSYDDKRKISHYNTSVNSRATVSASSADIAHWAFCDQQPSPDLSINDDDGDATSSSATRGARPERHCEKETNFDSRDFGELGEEAGCYPPEIECYENAHSRSVLS